MKNIEITGEELAYLKEKVSSLAYDAEKKISDFTRDLGEGSSANPRYAHDESQKLGSELHILHGIADKLRRVGKTGTDDATAAVH